MAKALTNRQRQFLGLFVQAYQAEQQPVHYVALAEQLGLGNVTVYEMLRVLEGRGLVAAEYRLPSEGRGPGRSTVLFAPTPQAYQQLGHADGANWEAIRDRLLGQVGSMVSENYEALLAELQARLPDTTAPQAYLAEMITAVILAVASAKKATQHNALLNRLSHIGLPGEIDLQAIAGISSALSMFGTVNRQVSRFLVEHSARYQSVLAELSEEKRRQLSAFARQVSSIVGG